MNFIDFVLCYTKRNWKTKLRIDTEEIASYVNPNFELLGSKTRSNKKSTFFHCTKLPRRQYDRLLRTHIRRQDFTLVHIDLPKTSPGFTRLIDVISALSRHVLTFQTNTDTRP